MNTFDFLSSRLDQIVSEDFSDLEARGELYWGGTDLEGVPTLTWLIGKHHPSNQLTDSKRFVRFFICQIEKGLRTSPQYPNSMFNIFVELTEAGLHSIDGNVAAYLQPILMTNYPKVRKGMFVFPVNWFVQLCWNTVLKPLISSLQPDIEDKICPLYGDFRPQLFARFDPSQVEIAFGGTLDLSLREPPSILAYQSVSLDAILETERTSKDISVSALHAAQYLASEKLGRLHAESANDGLRQRRVRLEAAHLGSLDNPDLKCDLSSKPRSTGPGSARIVLYTALVCCVLSGLFCSWTYCALSLLIMTAIAASRFCSSTFGFDDLIGDSEITADSTERDSITLLQRLEKERFRENLQQEETSASACSLYCDDLSHGAGSPRVAANSRSLTEWGACWFVEYSLRCGI